MILAQSPFSELSFYALVPDLNSLRWIIQIGNRRVQSAALRLYSPQSLKGRLFKRAAISLSYIGVQFIWGKGRLLVAAKERTERESLADFLKGLLDVPDVHLSVSTGTPGYYRKTTVQVMSKKGKAIAYAKIGDTPQAEKVLTQEAEILRRLSELSISTAEVPRLIYAGSFHESMLVLQSAPSGKTRSGPRQLGKQHMAFLAEVFNQSKVQETFQRSIYWQRIKSDFELLQAKIDQNWQERIQQAFNICEKNLADKTIPLGLCHRDFTPWNTLLELNLLYIFDWEYAVEEGIPFWDIFHFAFFPEILVRRRSATQIIKHWNSKEMRRKLEIYSKEVDVDIGFVPAFLLLYLVEISCFYLYMFHRDGLQDEQQEHVRNTWAGMLDELTNNWEQYWKLWQ